METTSHRPYAKYEDGSYRPILGYENQPGTPMKKVPFVPSGDGEIAPAQEFGEYEITVVEPSEDTRQILHG